jgi:hypothetical protein
MNSLTTAGLVFICAVIGIGVGMLIRRRLPEHHLAGDARDVVKLGMGVLSTLAALVLGLLVASAKTGFDNQSAIVNELGTNVILIDAVLARYGPDADSARKSLRESVTALMDSAWADPSAPQRLEGYSKSPVETIFDQVLALKPATDAQQVAKARALDLTFELAKIRLRLSGTQDNPLETPFLVVLIIWLTVLFTGYGMLAPGNPTIVAILIVSTISMAAAVFLIFELDTPFGGLMQVSKAPLQKSLAVIGP